MFFSICEFNFLLFHPLKKSISTIQSTLTKTFKNWWDKQQVEIWNWNCMRFYWEIRIIIFKRRFADWIFCNQRKCILGEKGRLEKREKNRKIQLSIEFHFIFNCTNWDALYKWFNKDLLTTHISISIHFNFLFNNPKFWLFMKI